MSNLRKSPKLPLRLFNPDSKLSAGGGGTKSKDRRLKLKAKNEKLAEERRRAQAAEKQSKKTKTQIDFKETEVSETGSSIHPSRRSMVANG